MSDVAESYLRQIAEDFASLRQRVERLERQEPRPMAVCAKITHSATQTIATATSTTLAFDTVVEDKFSFWSSGANSRLTVPAGYAGWYSVVASVRWNNSAVGRRQYVILRNGVAIGLIILPTNGEAAMSPATMVRLAVGDYIQLEVYQDSGGNLGIPALSGYSPMLMLNREGD